MSRLSTALAFFILSIIALTFGQDPNIVFIWFDDLGFNDVSYNGGPYSTPLLAEWANEDAIKLNFHYCEQVCSASRSALLTGRYSWKSGLNTVTTQLSQAHFDETATLYPQRLENRGYRGYMAGKWHVGYKYESICPHRRGFMNGTYGHVGTQYYNRGFRRSFDVYDEQFPCSDNNRRNAKICTKRKKTFRPQNRLPTHDTWTIANGTKPKAQRVEVPIHIGDPSYSEFLFSRGIMDFIKVQDGSAPFYIQYNLFTPHSSLVEPPNTTNDSYVIDYSLCNETYLLPNKQLFCRQMWYAQLKINEIFDTLKEEGFWNNTLVILTSDNGAAPESESGIAFGQTLPLRGTKSGPHEGGIRTPAMLKGGFIENLLQNYNISECEYNGLVHISDWYKILMDIIGIRAHDPDNDHDLEIWQDIKCKCDPTCNGDPAQDTAVQREEMIMMRLCGERGIAWPNGQYYHSAYIRQGRWKLVINGSYSVTDPCPPDLNATGLVPQNIFMGYSNHTIFPFPNQTFYDQIYLRQFVRNFNRSDLLYRSQCLDLLDNTTGPGSINDVNNSLFQYSPFMLFDVESDRIEACNVAELYPNITAALFARFQNKSMEYLVDEDEYGSPGALMAQVNSWDCDYDTTYLVPWEGLRDNSCGADGVDNITARICNSIYKQLNTKVAQCARRRLLDDDYDDDVEDKQIPSSSQYDYNWSSIIFYSLCFCIGVVIILLIMEFVSKYMEQNKVLISTQNQEITV